MTDAPTTLVDTTEDAVLLGVLTQVKAGDFTARMPLGLTGMAGKIADGLNDVIIANLTLAEELARISREVGDRAARISR